MHPERQAQLLQTSRKSNAPSAQKVVVKALPDSMATAGPAPSAFMLSEASPNNHDSTTVTTALPAITLPTVDKDGVLRYQAARDEIYDTVEEIERIDAAVEANRKKYQKPLEELKIASTWS